MFSSLLKISNLIDAINNWLGKKTAWLVLVVVFFAVASAILSKITSGVVTNAWLEIQTYLFAVVFLIGASYTFLHNEHVRIDMIFGRLSPKVQNLVDAICIVLFLFPFCALVIYYSVPYFLNSLKEQSSNAGGLIVWPARLLLPISFSLLMLQGVSEFIKRLAFIAGVIDNPLEKKQAKSDEEILAELIKKEHSKP